ncbi:uncharacterized protein PRCAT00001232001 [Priceomyces carsonii]|uniref:uncharacterized protein n=1 Tax=Priceomyces carsonii TaxID=28549 RepID=UPI002EDB15D1|nr:unnamed protein product [Priceomyces carsonii]
MTISEVSITASELSKESPITEHGLIELTKRFDEELLDSEQLINYLLLNLQKKSSKHKFIVQTVDVTSQVSINMDLNLVSRSGVLWDHNRDGYISLKVEIEENDIGSSKLEKELEKHDRCKAPETLVLVHSDVEDANNDEDVNHEEIDRMEKKGKI